MSDIEDAAAKVELEDMVAIVRQEIHEAFAKLGVEFPPAAAPDQGTRYADGYETADRPFCAGSGSQLRTHGCAHRADEHGPGGCIALVGRNRIICPCQRKNGL